MASPRGKLAFFSAYLRAALEGALRLVYAAMWIVAPTTLGEPWRPLYAASTTPWLPTSSVMHINERDGLYALSGLGRFTMTRFELVSAAEVGYWPSRRRRSPAWKEPSPS